MSCIVYAITIDPDRLLPAAQCTSTLPSFAKRTFSIRKLIIGDFFGRYLKMRLRFLWSQLFVQFRRRQEKVVSR
jgi:hypothetical protein